MILDTTSFWVSFAVIAAVIIFFLSLIGTYIYKKIHNIPTGDCAECHKNTKRLLKEYHKMYKNKKK